MSLRRMLFWASLIATCGGLVRAEDVVLKGVEVRNGEQCLEALKEFNWLCRQFELEGWVLDYGQPYWPNSQIVFYRHDLDDDGLDDAVVKIQFGGYCARGGLLNCEMLFLFGDQPAAEAPHRWGITGGGHILVTTRNSVRGIMFGGDSNDFTNKDDLNFISISQLKEKTLAAPKRNLGGF